MKPGVVVTRPEAGDGPLSESLRQVGCTPLLAPTVAYAGVPNAPDAPEVARHDWAVWTSAAAVEAVRPEPSETRHAVVGRGTQQALARCGVTADVAGDEGAEALAEVLAGSLAAGSTVIHPRSARAGTELADRLVASGLTVHAPVAYAVVPADSAPLRAALAASPRAITFASPSAVEGFCAAFPSGGEVDEAEAAVSDLAVASIGPTSTAALTRLLRAPDVEAIERTFTSLASGVAAVLLPSD